MIRDRFLTAAILVFVIAPPLSVSAVEMGTLPTIELPDPIHFTAPDGSDVVMAPGVYQMARGKESTLVLTGQNDQPVPEIQACTMSYGGVLEAPTALLIEEDGEEDEIHLVLLSPDGDDRDAIDTLSGTRSRATRYSIFADAFLGVLDENNTVLEAERLFWAVRNRVVSTSQKVEYRADPDLQPHPHGGP